MKTITKNAPLAALVALFLAVGIAPFAFAATAPNAASHATAQQQAQQQQQQPTSQEFTGKIMQIKNGQLALVTGKTDKGLSGHFLDDQDTAKKFVNQDVKVTGTLDTSTNTIHVTNIKGS